MLEVTCAVIIKRNLVLAVQRSHTMALPLKWEFPGGKVEPGETEETCLMREIQEELGVEIELNRKLESVEHDYGDFAIRLIPFLATIRSGEIQLKEHRDFCWLSLSNLRKLDWAAADLPVVSQVEKL
ncbi:(deoxy)nucleoside triphosphate pyrophosphohydrolase [Negadavirga shengliensis]|uniref:8-oxo-dGTP diphosphatase n=1 Tax=Negadavirga shengliensis TaxID=1389218 RepID=A0ABV9T558_9BACT